MASFKVLVVDDDAEVLDLVSEVLSAAGHTVYCASSAPQGIELARTEMPHLMLMDLNMPEMDGMRAVAALQSHPSTQKIPVVALTAAPSVDVAKLTHAGCVGYIPKPIDLTEFKSLIGQFLAVTTARTPRTRLKP